MQRRYWKGLVIALAILALACTTTLTGCKKKMASDPGMKTTGTTTSTGIYSGGASTTAPTPTAGGMSEADLAAQKAAEAKRMAEERARQIADQAMARFNTQNINFAFDNSDLSPEAMSILKDKANYLRQFPNKGVLIKGHCDDRGSLEYNLALGDRRANSAKNFLTDLGIDARRINTISYGEEMPLAQGQNEAAWAVNRRCEFALE
ncbi:MAG: OmpA family protein [Desulfatibacillum sp.]|nr:OmpA family protein [Desulfatibacillum sp.]